MKCLTLSLVFSVIWLSTVQAAGPQDCYDWLQERPTAASGEYVIYPGGRRLQVVCDMETDGGGWTYIHKRFDGSVDFFRPWADYKQGFGNRTKASEFYLGNDNIHRLTYQGKYELRIDLEAHNEIAFAEFASFLVADEQNKYRLQVSGYTPSSTAGDSMDNANGMFFTTYDRDSDKDANSNCAVTYHGAWWYHNCHWTNLNGPYHYNDTNKGNLDTYGKSMCYRTFNGFYHSLKSASMKIRPHYRPKDCWDVQQRYPRAASGVYTVYLGPASLQTGTAVYCDMTTDGGGWTTILTRKDGLVNFYRDYADYENGFGDMRGEYWLGLKTLHVLTAQRKYELRVDLESDSEKRFAKYSRMVVGDARAEYRLYASGYYAASTAGDSLKDHNGHTFSSRDRRTNLQCSGNCAVSSMGGWWYNCCHTSNLMGRYEYTSSNQGHVRTYATGVIWSSYRGLDYSLLTASMKLRPQLPCKMAGGVTCGKNGKCINVFSRGTAVCLCNRGYTGKSCETELEEYRMKEGSPVKK